MDPALIPQLAAELTNDPLSIGYRALITAGNDNGIASLLNLLTGPGSATITLSSLSGDLFRTGLLPAVLSLGSASAALQTKYQYILTVANAAQVVDMTNPYVLGAIQGLVTDALMTQAQATAINHRTGSRAEVLFGGGAIVTSNDVSKALRGL